MASTVNTTEAEIMKDPNAILFDPSKEEVNYIATDYILDNVKSIILAINGGRSTDCIRREHIAFVHDYESLFDMIIKGDDLSPLYMMIESMEKVNKGNHSHEDMDEKVTKMIRHKYNVDF